MTYLSLYKLKQLIQVALTDSEIIKGLNEAEISIEESEQIIIDQGEEVWNVVNAELVELDVVVKQISALKKNNPEITRNLPFSLDEENWYYIFFIPLLLFILGFVISPAGIPYLNDASNWLIYRWTSNIFIKVVSGFFFFVIASVILNLIVTFLIKVYVKQRSKIKNVQLDVYKTKFKELLDEYKALFEKQAGLEKLIDLNMIEKSIKDKLRDAINQKIAPSYNLFVDEFRTKGLGEVIDISKTIDTVAKAKLDFLFDTMPGGSIGIAGPRGAGKSTLIHTYCGEGRTVKVINDRPILSVMTSAPVKYDFRDFILHLFSSTCESVLKLENAPGESEFSLSEERDIFSPKFIFKKIFILLHVLTIFVGTLMIFGAMTLWLLRSELHHEKRAVLASQALVLENVDSLSKKNTNVKSPISKDKIKTETISNGSNDSFLKYYFKTINSSETLPARCFTYGIVLIILWFLLLICFGNVSFREVQETIFFIRAKKNRQMVEYRRKRNAEEYLHSASARLYLKKIKFQQSFTTGWSGGIKLPIAYEGNVQKAVTVEERAMSNPEIISAFTQFLSSICTHYQVIIGIDELDKMDSELDAKTFLNEIKSIFGLDRCFFLISVSENAMHNFERRGMPFRDVFDSSFDNIIHVDYLNLKNTVFLLQRRVIGRPMPFFYLSYCLSAGLARDIIRIFREIVHVSKDAKEMKMVCGNIVSEDLKCKFSAMSSIVRKLPVTLSEKDEFLNAIDTSVEAITIKKIKSVNAELNLILKKLETSRTDDVNLIEQKLLLNNMIKEVMAYLGYALTIWELFTTELNQAKLEALITENSFELIAKAKQSLSVDFKITQKLVARVRDSQGFSSLN